MKNVIRQVTHKNKTCIFNEDLHRYTVDNETLISVTTLIHKYFPVFDKDVAYNKAISGKNYKKYLGKTKLEVFKDWEDINKESLTRGSEIHKAAENYIKYKTVDYSKFSEYYHNDIKKLINFLDTEILPHFDVIEPEMMIFSDVIGVAGTIDLLLRHKKTGFVVMCDYKTNKTIKTRNPFQKGIYPLNNLDDCNFNHYSLQLSMYEFILIFEGYFDKILAKYLITINGDGVNLVKCLDMNNEIKDLIKSYLKTKN